jgi:CBS domain-containing protein
MTLEEIMTPQVVSIGPDEQASAAWTRMLRRQIRHLAVVSGGQLVGVISERDLGGRAGRERRRGRSVRDLMTGSVVSGRPEMSVDDAAALIRERLIGSLPVVDGDEIVGIVTATDVFDALAAERAPRISQAEAQLLRAPSSSRRLGGTPVARREREPSARKRERSSVNLTKRAPMPAQLPRATKRTAGRTEAPLVPVNIRAMGVEVDQGTREYIRRKLGTRLGKFATSIERVTARLRDVNGPRGGVDHECQVKVVLSGLPSVVVEAQDHSLQAAIDGAMAAATRGVRKSLQRRRTTPLKRVRS